MAKLNLDLTANKISSPSLFTTVPEGEYSVVVSHAEVKENKAGNGHYIEVGYEVVEGNLSGALIRDILNISNVNKDSERIGLDRLKTIATYTGAKNPNKIADTADFMNKKAFRVLVKLEDDGQYKNNRVKAVLPSAEVESEPKEEAKSPVTKKPWEKM